VGDDTAGELTDGGGESEGTGDVPGGVLDVYWVDVEGGAATLFATSDGSLVLVDAGFGGDRDADRIAAVVQEEIGADAIDLLIVTHYHVDHVGGVPPLVERVPVAAFWDHGDSVEAGGGEGQALWNGYLAVADGKRTVVAPGHSVQLGDLRLDVVSAGEDLIEDPLPGGGAPNPACDGGPQMGVLGGENPQSVGFVAHFGGFDLLDLGDLTWSYEVELACPVNRIGAIDLYQTTHHGLAESGAVQLVEGVDPTVVVMNNGPHKGGEWPTFERLFALPNTPDVWQLHRALANDDAHNTVEERIANPGEGGDDMARFLHAQVDAAGTVTLTNPRNGHTQQYASR